MWKARYGKVSFEGMRWAGFKALARLERGAGKFQIVPDRGRWVLVFMPVGQASGRGFYLESEKAGKVRTFVKAESALRIAAMLPYAGGVYVRFR